MSPLTFQPFFSVSPFRASGTEPAELLFDFVAPDFAGNRHSPSRNFLLVRRKERKQKFGTKNIKLFLMNVKLSYLAKNATSLELTTER